MYAVYRQRCLDILPQYAIIIMKIMTKREV